MRPGDLPICMACPFFMLAVHPRKGGISMSLKLDLVRPDDLLNLRIEAINLRLDAQDPAEPALVIEDPQRPAYLAFIFPPQTIAERAYFEAAIVNPPVDPNNPKAIAPEADPN